MSAQSSTKQHWFTAPMTTGRGTRSQEKHKETNKKQKWTEVSMPVEDADSVLVTSSQIPTAYAEERVTSPAGSLIQPHMHCCEEKISSDHWCTTVQITAAAAEHVCSVSAYRGPNNMTNCKSAAFSSLAFHLSLKWRHEVWANWGVVECVGTARAQLDWIHIDTVTELKRHRSGINMWLTTAWQEAQAGGLLCKAAEI